MLFMHFVHQIPKLLSLDLFPKIFCGRPIQTLLPPKIISWKMKRIFLRKGGNFYLSLLFFNPSTNSHIKRSHFEIFFIEAIACSLRLYSDKGRYTYIQIALLSLDPLLFASSTNGFINGRGPFEIYLFTIEIVVYPPCACSDVAVSSHLFYNCPLTTCQYISRPHVHQDNWIVNMFLAQI